MTMLQRLFDEQGQSPWLLGFDRVGLRSGQLRALVGDGIRGMTTHPGPLTRALLRSQVYDLQLTSRVSRGLGPEDAYWDILVLDVIQALAALRAIYEGHKGLDGFVAIDVPPTLAQDTTGLIASARSLQQQIAQPNLLVTIPATHAGVDALRRLAAQGYSTNTTAIFSQARYQQVAEAYIAGLETCPGDLSQVHGLATFGVGWVGAEVKRRLLALGKAGAGWSPADVALAQAKLVYGAFADLFSGARWGALTGRGARPQRLAWLSTPVPGPAQADHYYVDRLIGPGTVTIMDDRVITAFEDRGTVERTIDQGTGEAVGLLCQLGEVGLDMGELGRELETTHIRAATSSYQARIAALGAKMLELSG